MPSVFVVGSSNTDMVISSDRIPVPGETILGGTFAVVPGGKGANQAVSAARLGADVTLVARIGTDMFGDEALNQYEAAHIDLRYLVRDDEAPSGIAMIMVDRVGENAISVASGANMKLTSSDVEVARSTLVSADIVLLQLEIPYETVAFTANLASEHHVPVILNPAPARQLDDSLLRQIDYLTPNELEAASLTGIEVVDDTSASRAAHRLLDRGVGTVIITMGDRGAYWATTGGDGRVASASVSPVDTTAAGDAFNGGLAVALSQGQNLKQAIRFASYVGAVAVTRSGAQPSLPTLDEVEALMAQDK